MVEYIVFVYNLYGLTKLTIVTINQDQINYDGGYWCMVGHEPLAKSIPAYLKNKYTKYVSLDISIPAETINPKRHLKCFNFFWN